MIGKRSISALSAFALLAVPGLAQKQVPARPTKPGTPPAVTTVPLPPSGSYLGGSDDCATPMPINGQGTFPFDTTTGTTGTDGQNEANCYAFGTSGIDNDVWFEWTPTASGLGIFETCNLAISLDTKIAAYPAGGCPATGTSLACNDDTCGLLSHVLFPVVSGTSYLLQLGHYPGAPTGTGMFLLEVVTPPPNDDCSSPDVLPGSGAYPIDLQYASTGTQGQNEALCYDFGTTGIDSDVWYTYVANCDGMATLQTCGLLNVDTKLAVWPGAGCPADGTSIACNDDSCTLQSSVTWMASGGSTYTLQIGTFPGTGSNTTAGMFMVDLPGCPSGPGTAICFGDGSGAPCGCGNESNPGDGAGCLNSLAVGAVLSATGTADVTADTVVLEATGVRTQPGLFFQGDNAVNGGSGATFGDGIRCCGQSVIRLEVVVPSAPEPATATLGVTITNTGPSGTVNPGDTKCYQYWYRDPGPMNPCGSNFNLSNGVSITWS